MPSCAATAQTANERWSGHAGAARHSRGRIGGAARAPARAGAARRLDRLRAVRRQVHPVLHRLRLPLDGAPGGLRAERGRRHGRVRARVRGRARACRDGLRARRVLPGVPGDRAPDAHPRARARRPRHPGSDQRRPGRLPGDPRLPGPGAERGDGGDGRAALGRDRGDDGAQERERDRAHPRERPLVRARAPAPAGVHATRRHRDRGEPQGGHEATLAMLEALGDRSAGSRARPTAHPPATAGRSGCAARGRTPWPTTSSSSRATCS